MAKNGSFKQQLSSEYALSHELLYILEWIIEHEYESLKGIVENALSNSHSGRIYELGQTSEQVLEHEAQYSILELLALLETAFIEVINEGSVRNLLERNLLPAIDHFDINQCDNALVAASVAQATSKLEKNPQANPQEVLFKELLRRWKPKKAPHGMH